MNLDGLSPLDKLARARMSTISLGPDASILDEMPPPFELSRLKHANTRRQPINSPAPSREQRRRSSTAQSLPSPAPSRSTTLTSENLDLSGPMNDSSQTLDDADGFDWSEKSGSKASLLSWLHAHPADDDAPVTAVPKHGPSRSWDLTARLSPQETVAATKHQKSSSLWGYSSNEYDGEPMLTPPVEDPLNIAVHRGAYFVEVGDKEAGVKCWRTAKDGGNIFGQLLYFLAVDAGWTFDAAHPNLGKLLARVDPQSLRAILSTECPRIADAFYRYSTHQSAANARLALTMAATINSAGRTSALTGAT